MAAPARQAAPSRHWASGRCRRSRDDRPYRVVIQDLPVTGRTKTLSSHYAFDKPDSYTCWHYPTTDQLNSEKGYADLRVLLSRLLHCFQLLFADDQHLEASFMPSL
jgi:hypothetical protein